MNDYVIKWKKSAVKELQCLPKDIAIKILDAVTQMQRNPHPINSKKLKAVRNHYRLKISEYRVLYSIFDLELYIEVIKVSHRKDAYKQI